jgi:uncharacterized membrane protein YraQ (UPF0718 family)
MIGTLVVMWGLAAITAGLAWRRPGRFAVGVGYAKEQLLIILPRLPISFFAAGFIAELLPKDQIGPLIGAGSGFTGIVIAALFGALIPSGPIVSFPIAIALAKLGAGTPQLVAFIAAWSCYMIQRLLMWEIPLMGWGFAWRRMVASLPLPFLCGLLAAGLVWLLGAAPALQP